MVVWGSPVRWISSSEWSEKWWTLDRVRPRCRQQVGARWCESPMVAGQPVAVSVTLRRTGRGKQGDSGFDLNVKRTAGGKGRTVGGQSKGSEPRWDPAAGVGILVWPRAFWQCNQKAQRPFKSRAEAYRKNSRVLIWPLGKGNWQTVLRDNTGSRGVRDSVFTWHKQLIQYPPMSSRWFFVLYTYIYLI